MNAVIVDIRKKQAAALDENGRIIRIRNAGYEVGQTIELHEIRPVRTPSILKRLSTGAAAAVFVAIIGTGAAYAIPYGTVTLDGDSSIEYTINCFDYVLDVKAADEEGEALLAEIDVSQLRHHRVDQAVSVTVEHLENEYTEDTAPVLPEIRVETRNEKHSERLREEMAPMLEHRAEQPQPGIESPEALPSNHGEAPMLPSEQQAPLPGTDRQESVPPGQNEAPIQPSEQQEEAPLHSDTGLKQGEEAGIPAIPVPEEGPVQGNSAPPEEWNGQRLPIEKQVSF